MNPVTYSLTPEDWAEYHFWVYENQSNREVARKRQLGFSLLTLLPMYLFLFAIFGFSLVLFLTLAAVVTGTILVNRFLYSPEQIRKQFQERSRLESAPSDTRTVSLTPRGVLEVDETEERLTLYDAITESTLTDKFLYSKDRKGGVLLIPTRIFASSAAAAAFHLELENRRMRHAVGLTPSTPIISTPVPAARVVEATPVVSTPPQTQASQPWWRSAPRADNESIPNRKS